MSLPKEIDLGGLRRSPGVSFYFRYPLHHQDFYEVKREDRRLGYFAAKPLYGKLDPKGRVDRSAGYSGEIAVLYLPEPASSGQVELLFTHLPVEQVTTASGKRNWTAIRQAGEQAILEIHPSSMDHSL